MTNQSRRRRFLAAAAVAGSAILSLSARVAPIAAAGALLPGCSADCELRQCDDLIEGASDLSTNGKTYTHCLSCDSDGYCDTQLQDDTGATFFDCQDGEGSDCTTDVVNAEFAYCDVQ